MDEIIIAGFINSGSKFVAAFTVYDVNGIAPTLTTTHPGIGLPKIEVVNDE